MFVLIIDFFFQQPQQNTNGLQKFKFDYFSLIFICNIYFIIIIIISRKEEEKNRYDSSAISSKPDIRLASISQKKASLS